MEFKNITYSHEHMRIDLSEVKRTDDCNLDVYTDALDELKALKNRGVVRLVDCSNHGMGVDWGINKKIEEETGLQIVCSTGFYKEPFLPKFVETSSVEDLIDIMVDDINHGAKVIGEIGTSEGVMTELERKVFEAACMAQKKTDAVIITHTSLGTLIKDQCDFFLERGVDPKKVIISHVALSNDINAIKYALSKKFNVAFDTIGKLTYLSDEIRIEFLDQLIKEGYTNQILMSMDITRKSHLIKNGGVGYLYLLDTFIPKLFDVGISEADINQIIAKNFETILERAE